MSGCIRPVQYFTDEYLESCRAMQPQGVLEFLESFRILQNAKPATTKLISVKVPEDLLHSFRLKADAAGVKYQTQIKTLMREWLS